MKITIEYPDGTKYQLKAFYDFLPSGASVENYRLIDDNHPWQFQTIEQALYAIRTLESLKLEQKRP